MTAPFKKNIQFGNQSVGENSPCYIVAEIGVNFNGSLDVAKQSIDAASESGANAVKFQTFKAEEFVADKNLMYSYKTDSGETKTESQYDMFKRLELPDEWHSILLKYATSKNVDFFSSVADVAAVDLLHSLKVPALKLASEDLINVSLLDYVASKKMPVILSTGMGDLEEIEEAVAIFKKHRLDDLIILHCTSSYPTPPESCNLRKIQSLREKFGALVGFSDHTEGPAAAVASIVFGACMVEKHFTLSRKLPGPDHKMSMEPQDFKNMVDQIRLSEKMLGSARLTFDSIEEKSRLEFRRSIVAKRDIPSGTILNESLLSYKRPGTGLKPTQRVLLIGKKTTRDIAANERIHPEDVS